MDETPQRLARLIGEALADAHDVRIDALTRVFGGNARTAFSFELGFRQDGVQRSLACVLLQHAPGRQVSTDVAQEFRALRALDGATALFPAAIASDSAGRIMGAPSIVLQRLPGKTNAVEFLKSEDPAVAASLVDQLAQAVARLHSVPIDAAAFDPALRGLSAREVALRQVTAWRDTFLAQRMEPLPALLSVFEWLCRHLPQPDRLCLVHGDVRPGNFLYEGKQLTGLLDWEMAHPGDPTEDLAWIYRPLWSPRRFMELGTFIERYGAHANRTVRMAEVIYYRIFSEAKFATISLTAARAFASGETGNLRHADRAAAVPQCVLRCLQWMRQHRELADAAA
jgi:aminoglycoside phosphotransferase (APT) family kinase protein